MMAEFSPIPCEWKNPAMANPSSTAPVFSERERLEIVAALKCVDGVFLEESLEQKRDYLVEHGADILVMGDDWKGRFDEFSDIVEVVYLPRTPAISTTALIEKISGSCRPPRGAEPAGPSHRRPQRSPGVRLHSG